MTKIAFVINPNSKMISEREGTMGCLLYLFVGLKTLGILISWLLRWGQNNSITNFNQKGLFCISSLAIVFE